MPPAFLTVAGPASQSEQFGNDSSEFRNGERSTSNSRRVLGVPSGNLVKPCPPGYGYGPGLGNLVFAAPGPDGRERYRV